MPPIRAWRDESVIFAPPRIRPPAPFIESLSVTCVDGSVLMLDDARASWTEPDGTTHSVPYEQVVELRFDVANRRGPQLVVVQKSGKKWQFVVNAADVARVQDTLDALDGQFAEPVAPDRWMGLARLLAAVGAAISLALGMIGLALVTILAAVRPSARFLAAARCGALRGCRDYAARSALRGRTPDRHLPPARRSWRRVDLHGLDDSDLPAGSPRHVWHSPDLASLLSAQAVAIFFGGSDALGMHQNAVAMPGGAAVIAAFSGALALPPAAGTGRSPLIAAMVAMAA